MKTAIHITACSTFLALFLFTANYSHAAVILNFDPTTGNTGFNNDQSVGWQFDVLSPLTVTNLLWFDQDLDGLNTAHTVGIWDGAGTLLGSATIPSGTGATLDGIWRSVAVTPFNLAVGSGYIVGGTNLSNSTDRLAANVSQIVDARISFVDATFSNLTAPNVLVRPTSFSTATTGFYGPSFAVNDVNGVPEPSTIAIWSLLGFVGAAVRRRKGSA
jgi:hypothetical protein